MTSPSPTAAQTLHLSDFDQASAMFSRWQGRFEQLSSGRFKADLRIVRGALVRVMAIEANQRVLLRGQEAAGLLAVYPVIPGNAASLWQGQRLAPGQLVIHGVEADVNHCSARQTDDLGVSLRPDVIEDAARSLLAVEAPALPRSWEVSSPRREVFTRLNGELTRLLAIGAADPALLGTPEGHALEQECVRALVSALFPAAAQSARWPRLSGPKRSQLLRRAEELMRSRLSAPLGTIDLCRELGVSDRTLRLAFRTQYGLGPMVYYRCLRLNAVRAQLKALPHLAVADVARAHGFHHQGNFAADYRRLFGTLPSQTSRRN